MSIYWVVVLAFKVEVCTFEQIKSRIQQKKKKSQVWTTGKLRYRTHILVKHVLTHEANGSGIKYTSCFEKWVVFRSKIFTIRFGDLGYVFKGN